MKQILHGEYLLQEVPIKAKQFDIFQEGSFLRLDYWIYEDEDDPKYWSTIIPPSNWTIIGKGDELRESDWHFIVDSYFGDVMVKGCYRDYETKIMERHTATQSGLSLLKSHSMKPETTLILKKTE